MIDTMTTTRSHALVTEADFLSLPVSANKTELLDGEVIVAPSGSPRHQLVVGNLHAALRRWADSRTPRPFVGLSPFDVRFGADRILQPDLFVLLGHVDLDAPQPWTVVPDLCVEVISSDRVYDRVTKRLIYAQAGVKEYWTVEPYGVVERWTGDGLAVMAEIRDRLTTPLLPDFDLDVPELFR